MILPIYTYGEPILRLKANDISLNQKDIKKDIFKIHIPNMLETVHNANGAGLAAPQIGLNIKLIVVDQQISDTEIFKGVFINANILRYFGYANVMDEGCLSLPKISAFIIRLSEIEVEWYDENWKYHKEKFNGIKSRILQHEIDHTNGILFTDRIINKDIKLKLSSQLDDIKNKKIKVNYPVI